MLWQSQGQSDYCGIGDKFIYNTFERGPFPAYFLFFQRTNDGRKQC